MNLVYEVGGARAAVSAGRRQGTDAWAWAYLMNLAGLLLLVAGWVIVVAAVGWLAAAPARDGFILAGLAVELLGLVLVGRAHRNPQGARR